MRRDMNWKSLKSNHSKNRLQTMLQAIVVKSKQQSNELLMKRTLTSWELQIKQKNIRSSNLCNPSNRYQRSHKFKSQSSLKTNYRSNYNEKRCGKTVLLTKKARNSKFSQMTMNRKRRSNHQYLSIINRGHDGVRLNKHKK